MSFTDEASPWLRLYRRLHGVYRNERSVLFAFLKLYGAVYQRKEGVVFANPDVGARVMGGASLPHDDVAGDNRLSTENFNAQSFAMRLAAVVRTTCSFFVCHVFLSYKLSAVSFKLYGF
jgi:hypothetical protein